MTKKEIRSYILMEKISENLNNYITSESKRRGITKEGLIKEIQRNSCVTSPNDLFMPVTDLLPDEWLVPIDC